jgi:hypothetical protein
MYEAQTGKVFDLLEAFQAGELEPKGKHIGLERKVGR